MTPFSLSGLLMLIIGAIVTLDVTISRSGATLLTDQEIPKKKCRYNRPYSLLQALCNRLDLTYVPANLQTGIQILDASYNRIRSLSKNSFSDYTDLMFVYLADNFIVNIEEAAFSELSYLEVLDLSKNGVQELPGSLFKLPRLRTLYLDDNWLTDKVFETKVTSPLESIQLWKNKLTRIPNIGIQPTLKKLNVSGNSITNVHVDDIALFCSLKILDLTNNPIAFNASSCDCHGFKAWIQDYKIDVRPVFNCNNNSYGECVPAKHSNRTLSLRQDCADIIKAQIEAEKARATWILVASIIAGIIAFVCIILYCVHKRNKKRREKSKKRAPQLPVNSANAELLSGNGPHERT